jgi:Ser/Thr protein kinase RdoA (MazF antagonist)
MTFAARGELGRIWRLTTDRGTFAVKQLLFDLDEDEAQSDVALQTAALSAGVPLPRPLLTGAGLVVAQRGEPSRPDMTVRAYEWVDLPDPPMAASPRQAAALLGGLHAAAPPHDGPVDPWFTDPVPADRWRELVHATRAAGAAWSDSLAQLVAEIEDCRSIIDAGRHEPLFHCHLDFNPQNVLLTVDGQPMVFDWENSGAACLEQELAASVTEFVPDPSNLPSFLDAYRAVGGPVRTLRHDSFAMTMAVIGHLVEMYAERAIDPHIDAETRARATFWLLDIAANSVTRRKIDAWVDAAPRS